MSDSFERYRGLQAYIFDYVTGLLWLVTGVVAFVTQERLTAALNSFVAPITAANVKVPEIMTGFLLVVAGVVLPYCVAVALKPMTLRLMTIVRRLQRFANSKLAILSHKEMTGRSLKDGAVDIVNDALYSSGVPDRHIVLAYLHEINPRGAERLDRKKEEVWFRAASVLPTALLFSATTYRLPLSMSSVAAYLVGILVFWAGAWYVNRELANWDGELATTTLLSAKTTGATSQSNNAA